jgi:hypothetical protein
MSYGRTNFAGRNDGFGRMLTKSNMVILTKVDIGVLS